MLNSIMLWAFCLFSVCLVLLNSCLCAISVTDIDEEGKSPPIYIGISHLACSIIGVTGLTKTIDGETKIGVLLVLLTVIITLVTIRHAQNRK